MKKLILLTLFISGCATNRVTPEDLMRSSYFIGCGEARMAYIEADGKNHQAALEGVIRLCKEKSEKSFDLRQTGIYNERMEIVERERPQGKERN